MLPSLVRCTKPQGCLLRGTALTFAQGCVSLGTTPAPVHVHRGLGRASGAGFVFVMVKAGCKGCLSQPQNLP